MKRPRFSLRLLLLIMALCAVSTAWLKARHDLHKVELRGQLDLLELERKENLWRLENDAYADPFHQQTINSLLKTVDADIDRTRTQLGQTAPK